MAPVIVAVKAVGGLVTSIGIGAVTENIIRVTTPETTKAMAKVCIKVGSYAIGGIAAATASKQFGNTVDTVVMTVEKMFHKNSPEEEVKEAEA